MQRRGKHSIPQFLFIFFVWPARRLYNDSRNVALTLTLSGLEYSAVYLRLFKFLSDRERVLRDSHGKFIM
jgi:hypothetical protein